MDLFRHLRNAYDRTRPPEVRVPDGPDTPPVRKRYRFSGSVQGVGFRYEARMIAIQLGLTGWAQNKSDGTVLVEIEGPESHISEFMRAMQAVPRFHISDIEAEDLPLTGAETTFKIRY